MADPNVNPRPSFLSTLLSKLKEYIPTFIVTTLIGGILTVFSGVITERIKFAINRTDQQIVQYQALSEQLSKFVFATELLQESYASGTGNYKEAIVRLHTYYNDAIIKMREGEYVTYSKVKRFWGDDSAKKFEQIIVLVKEIDADIHQINPEVKRIELSDNKKEEIPLEKLKPIAEKIKPKIELLKKESREFLVGLVEKW